MKRPLVDAAPSRLSLQALAAAGYPLSHLADLMATKPGTLGEIRRGNRRYVTADMHQRIAYTHRGLRDADPADHGIPTTASHVALLQAAREGWTTGDGQVAA
jgi:hypothetical protein